MKWKYYMPHVWDSDRTRWVDIHLLPCDESYEGESIWLTVDALGQDPGTENEERYEFYLECLEKLGDNDYVIDGTDMIVKADDFSKPELLEWVKVWFSETGLPADDLVAASLEDFAGTSEHLELIADLKSKFEEQ